MTWLTEQCELLDTPFSWEMPDATFPENTEVQTFLRGAAKWTRESQRKWFDERQRKLELYKEELKQLKEQCGGDTRGSDN
ncbi:hypothetical protein PInf_003626 [Phytophthora infestans]|nr:hypothetical protein PInf_003626 [Phytophthora infestans]